MIKLLNQIRGNTTLSWHHILERNHEWYASWHRHAYHKHIHFGVFFVVLIFSFSTAYGSYLKTLHSEEVIVMEETTPIDTPTIEAITPPTDTAPAEIPEQTIIINQSQLIITKVISPIPSGVYSSGVVPIVISFNKPVYVSGTPQLIILTGNPKTTSIDYRHGSGSKYLTFLYHIIPGNFSSALDYANSSALILNGGGIKDKAGNDAVLTLPELGSSGSLSGYSKIIISTESVN